MDSQAHRYPAKEKVSRRSCFRKQKCRSRVIPYFGPRGYNFVDPRLFNSSTLRWAARGSSCNLRLSPSNGTSKRRYGRSGFVVNSVGATGILRTSVAHTPIPPTAPSPPPPTLSRLRNPRSRSRPSQPIEGTDVYVALVFSCQELPDLQELHKLDPDAKIVFFNLRLDTLRGDLGLPAFPPKVTRHRACRTCWKFQRGTLRLSTTPEKGMLIHESRG